MPWSWSIADRMCGLLLCSILATSVARCCLRRFFLSTPTLCVCLFSVPTARRLLRSYLSWAVALATLVTSSQQQLAASHSQRMYPTAATSTRKLGCGRTRSSRSRWTISAHIQALGSFWRLACICLFRGRDAVTRMWLGLNLSAAALQWFAA